MGQRHQLFIKILNPYKNDSLNLKPKDKVKAAKMFGKGKYTMLALHNQWLYGRSALHTAAHILNVTNKETANVYHSPFGERFYTYSNFDKTELEIYIESVMMMINVVTDPTFPRGIGIEGNRFLNDMCIDNESEKYEPRWDIRKDFRMGDNNYGITIIDTIERKYCFMNIHDFAYEGDDGIYGLGKFKPATAIQYAKAYYPKRGEKKDNNKAASLLSEFDLLTIEEVGKMFPGMKEILGLKKKKAKV